MKAQMEQQVILVGPSLTSVIPVQCSITNWAMKPQMEQVILVGPLMLLWVAQKLES